MLTMIFSLAAGLAGCGETPGQEAAAGNYGEVELLEPVGLTANGEAAQYRNLYDAKVYSATVVPHVEEYAFEENVVLDNLQAFPGEAVSKGEVLVSSSTAELDRQIEQQQERIEQMEKEFAEYEAQVRENLAEPQEEVKRLKTIVENLEKSKPSEYLGGRPSQSVSGSDALEPGEDDASSPEPVPNPAYQEWEQEYNSWNGQYRIKSHNVNTTLLQLEQRSALYELDHAYALQQLGFLQDRKNNVTVHAGMAGNVVAVTENRYGDYVQGEAPIVAVGDPQRKELKCDFINSQTASDALEIYAIIDGRRYEVTYVPIESEEYTRLTTQDEDVFTTLYLQGDTEEVSIGDYAAVIVVRNRKEQVLSVPAEAIHKDDSGRYVYVIDGENNVYTPVRTGMSDGVYTEILSGLEQGDAVRLDQGRSYTDQRVTVEKGDFYSDFSGNGYMFYPSSMPLQNPITHGTVYFQEYQTAMYQHVEKGDVIATVRVAADEIGMQRLLLQLQRETERMQDLEKQGGEENEKAIENRMEAIEKIQEQIAELNQDYQTTQIRATHSGIVIWMEGFEKEDILKPDCSIIEIADENTCYVALENKGDVLAYGNQVKVFYSDLENQNKETVGMVANLSRLSLSKALQSEYAYILLPPDVVGDMSVATEGWGGWWNRASFSVAARLREMDNVLLVPRQAVRESEGHYYVNVVEADGNIVRRSFIAGGFDKSNYWVAEGLTEGMELCLE